MNYREIKEAVSGLFFLGIFKTEIDDYRQLVSKGLLPNETFFNEMQV